MTATAPTAPTAAGLDPEACYRAVSGRDARHDGRLWYAVTTTGVFCRPSCPSRTPRPENCRWFGSPEAAASAGFRPCRRCRPDRLAGPQGGSGEASLARRAVTLLGQGAADDLGVGGLAGRLGVSERHLHRVLVREVGAGPQQLARSRRAQTARLLLEQTAMPVTEVAFAAGFASVRQFNDVVRAELGCTPTGLRARRGAGGEPDGGREPAVGAGLALALRLRHREPLATGPLQRFLAAHAVPGLERHDAGAADAPSRHTRVLPGPSGPAVVEVTLGAAHDHVPVRLRLADVADVGSLVARLRRWLDLDADPAQIDGALAREPALAPLVAARPGLRVPGAVDGGETALLAVLGQQVSLGAARTFAGRLVAAFGRPVDREADEVAGGLHAFPTPDDLAAAGPDALRAATGVTTARARTVHALASALAGGGLALDPAADYAAARARLLALPGIGPWTTEYVALRALADPDAFPADDLVLKRALAVRTAREATARAAGWRPWRGYALLHLWTREVFA